MLVVTHDAYTTPNCIEYVKVRCEVRQYGAWVTEEMRPVGKASARGGVGRRTYVIVHVSM